MAKDRKSIAMQNQIWELRKRGVPIRKISESLRISRKTVRKYIARKEQPSTHQDEGPQRGPQPEVDPLLELIAQAPLWLQALDWRFILSEKAKGVPSMVLWKEAREQGCPVQYWSFHHSMKQLLRCMPSTRPVYEGSMRMVHKPAERVMVDYCDGIEIWDSSGRMRKTQLFVGVLPFSSLVYAEFSFNQKQPSFIGSMERMWGYFGGVTPYAVCDNLKSGVSKADWYDPEVNPTFQSYANHAGFAVLPTRPYKPKDKGSVERHVGALQKDFFFHIRHKTFYCLSDLNKALLDFLADFNSRIMKDYGVSRLDRFQKEKDLLQPLPLATFETEEWKQAKVHGDCHIQVDRHFYSVPHQYIHQIVSVKLTPRLVVVTEKDTGNTLATHTRYVDGRGQRSTNPSHWPEDRQQQMNWSMQSALTQAKHLGNQVCQLVQILSQRPHPLQYLRRIQGLLRLYQSKAFAHASLEYACGIAMEKQEWRLHTIRLLALHHTKANRPPSLIQQAPLRPDNTLYLSN